MKQICEVYTECEAQLDQAGGKWVHTLVMGVVHKAVYSAQLLVAGQELGTQSYLSMTLLDNSMGDFGTLADD